MYQGQKVIVVLPAYRAAATLARTCAELDADLVDEVVLVDDYSPDDTVAVAQALGLRHVVRHDQNRGYGANQKTCYRYALSLGADLVVMLHPDYQYSPRLLPVLVAVLGSGHYAAVFGSRILGGGALRGGMPVYKYVANRGLTLVQNLLMGQKLSEYHTGYRAYTREVLEAIDFEANSDDFVFDNQLIAQVFAQGFDIAEVTCPTRYFAEASSIDFRRSVRYGLGVLGVSVRYALHRMGWRWPLMAGRSEAVGTQDSALKK
jgi:glycosyltransferase involved in cell wall biosynthesis